MVIIHYYYSLKVKIIKMVTGNGTDAFWDAFINSSTVPGGAQGVGDSLRVGEVASSGSDLDFPDEDEGGGDAGVIAAATVGKSEGGNKLMPRMVAPGAITATINAWNRSDKVGVDLVSLHSICGVRSKPSEVGDSYQVCGNERCTVTIHQARMTKEGMGIELPADGGEVYAIQSSNTSKTQRLLWNAPSLPVSSLPKEMRTWTYAKTLKDLQFPARVWKLIFEGYPGMEDMGKRYHEIIGGRPPMVLDIPIPSPSAGAGGAYKSDEFADYPEEAEDTKQVENPSAIEEQPNLFDQIDLEPLKYSTARGLRSETNSFHPPSESSPPSMESDPYDGHIMGNTGLPYFTIKSRSTRMMGGGQPTNLKADNPFDVEEASAMSLSSLNPTTVKLQAQLNKLTVRLTFLRDKMQERTSAVNDSLEGAALEMQDVHEELTRIETIAVDAQSLASRGGGRAQGAMEVERRAAEMASQFLNDRDFQDNMVRLIASKMKREGTFVTTRNLDDKLAGIRNTADPSSTVTPDAMMGVTSRVASLEAEVTKPGGAVAGLLKDVKELQDRRNASACVRGNKTFKDQHAVDALVSIMGDSTCFRLVPDMFSLLLLAPEQFDTVEGLVKNEADVARANYTSALEATVSASFSLTYPPWMIVKTKDSNKGTESDLVKWASGYSNRQKFMGVENDGTYETLLNDLLGTQTSMQQSIDYQYPADTHATINAILTEQLNAAYRQATSFLKSFDTLYNRVKKGAADNETAWQRVLVYAKSVFDDIKTKRVAAQDRRSCSAKIWSAFQVTDMLKEYERNRWIQHSGVSSILSFSALQSSGKLHEALGKRVTAMEAKVKTIEEQWSRFKTKNNNLKFN